MLIACPNERPVRRAAKLLTAALAIASATLLAACARPYADYCKTFTQCGGGNDADIDACQAGLATSEEVAAAYDCSQPFDKVWDCMERTATCKGGSFSTDCSTEKKALATCQDAASARGNGSSPSGSGSGSGNGNGNGNGSTPSGEWCGKLAPLCATCKNATTKTQCDALVTAGNDTNCKTGYDNLQALPAMCEAGGSSGGGSGGTGGSGAPPDAGAPEP